MDNDLVIQRERSHELWGEIVPLLQAHKDEVSFYPDIALDPDVEAYNCAEDHGMLRCYTARRRGALIGYEIFFIKHNMHYRHSVQAVQDANLAEIVRQ